MKDEPTIHGDAIELDPRAYTRAQLLEAASGGNEALHPVIAVSLLRRKQYSRATKSADLVGLLDDKAVPERAQRAAALELGRLGTTDAIDALRRRTRRRTATGLFAKAGIAEADRLGRAAKERAPEAVAVKTAWATPDLPILSVRTERAEPITQRKATRGQIAKASADLANDIEAMALQSDHARALRCAGRTLLWIPVGELDADAAHFMVAGRDRLAGVVATLDSEESGMWGTRYFAVAGLSRRDNAGRIPVRVVTRRGRVVLAGEALRSKGTITFSLKSVADAGNAPTVVEGEYAEGVIKFSRAESDPAAAARLYAQPRR